MLCSLALSTAVAAQHRPDGPEGHWEGRVEVPGSPLEVVVDLTPGSDGAWTGQIEIAAQGLRAFPLSQLAIDGPSVTFAMAGVPGVPTFEGELAEDGSILVGRLSQGGASFPFRLQRTGETRLAALPPAPPVEPEIASALTGRWEGSLEVPGRSVPVAFVLTPGGDGRMTSTFDSPSEGRTGMPVSRLVVDGSAVRVEMSYAGVVFEGTLNESRTELAGTWSQGGGALPLTLRQPGPVEAGPFPPADPEAVGIPARALELLATRVQAMVDQGEIVGGELTVIKNRRTVFSEAFGWKDRDAEEPMETGALYCVRSMTKPFVGASIQMLIDEGKLSLETPVREILPSFSGPRTANITIEHLLTHTSGFPFTTITRPLGSYADLAEVAAESAATELEFETGTRFGYSDANSDTLGAVVAAIAGMPVERFIQQRILDPLGMSDTVVLLGEDEDIRGRIPSAYSGGTGSWSRHWAPSDPAIFPLFLTSQSLYSTTTDYARFLAWWMDGGRIGDRQLLSVDAVERAMTPGRQVEGQPASFRNLDTTYGHQWMVYARSEGEGAGQRVAFGHNGSDGTYAWAWPEQDLMVLFFTQSRGTLAGIGLERLQQTLLIDQRLDDPSVVARVARVEEIEGVAGLYWDEDVEEAYLVVTPVDNRLELERPGKMRIVFRPGDVPGRFVAEINPQVWIEFVRDEQGAVTTLRTFFGRRVENDPRHVPVAGLPSVEDVVAQVRRAHGTDRLDGLGGLRLTGTLTLEARDMEGEITSVIDGERFRADIDMGVVQETIALAGDRAWIRDTVNGVKEIDGSRRVQLRLDHPAVRLGDWRRHYRHVEVLRRVQIDDHTILMVRVEPDGAPGATMFVDEKTGLLVRTERLVQVPGVGLVGVRSNYGDFRDVDGLKIPFREESTFANPMIGKVVTRLAHAETGVELSAEMFSPPANPGD